MNRVLLNLFFNAAVIHTAFDTFACVDAKEQTENTTKLRQRMLKSPKAPKSPKSAKPKIVKDFCPVETVTAEVYTVQGSTAEVVGSTQFSCLDLDYVGTADGLIKCGSFYSDPNDLSALTLASVEFLEQGKGTTWDEPLFFNSNAVSNQATFQFTTERSSPGSLNDSSFQGSVGDSNPNNKVTLQFMDLSPLEDIARTLDPTSTFQYNPNLFNKPATSIESIQYDFFPAECDGITNCYKQFYLNIQLRSSARPFGDTTGLWRDCNLAYVPPSGDVGAWTTFKIDASTPVTEARDCPDDFATLGEAHDDGYVLGTSLGLIFQLSMGDTNPTDNGLVGYFDNIQLKVAGEDLIVYDL